MCSCLFQSNSVKKSLPLATKGKNSVKSTALPTRKSRTHDTKSPHTENVAEQVRNRCGSGEGTFFVYGENWNSPKLRKIHPPIFIGKAPKHLGAYRN